MTRDVSLALGVDPTRLQCADQLAVMLRFGLLDNQWAAGCLPNTATFIENDVEANDRRGHAVEAFAQACWIANSVLQADNERIGSDHGRELARDFLCLPALDRNQDNVAVAERCDVGFEANGIAFSDPFCAFERNRRQAVGFDLDALALTTDHRDLTDAAESGAYIAADSARTDNSDSAEAHRSIRAIGHGSTPAFFASARSFSTREDGDPPAIVAMNRRAFSVSMFDRNHSAIIIARWLTSSMADAPERSSAWQMRSKSALYLGSASLVQPLVQPRRPSTMISAAIRMGES